MNKKNIKVSVLMALVFANGVFASGPKSERDDLVINSVSYIEDDTDYDLGFDTADYLPEDFDPYKLYVDLDAIDFIEDEENLGIDTKKYLPKGFDAYAFPKHVADFNYIDENDYEVINFDTKEHLPEGFDPYIRKN
ncbi:hypothetical protein [Pseudozobellia thermophila]|uniref:Uncharacterized protein n=1 Tax=Pseudozobellia thermophila TaxID=192903 RepID=A0A1M6NG10_9FLAO|nr:hypothetical protein [Pseudozobellia thermophila]SHJ94701.1 hypothetical protein SAMN04488513_11348 [Pseudozobellia thermophila]